MPKYTDYGDETASIELPIDALDRLVYRRDELADRLADRELDHDADLAQTVRWLLDRRESAFNRSQENRKLGRIEQRGHDAIRYGENLEGDDLDAALDEVMGEQAVHVIYSSAAHDWQGEHDEESGLVELDEAADPADLSLVVSTTGLIMRGGSVSSVEIVEDGDAVEWISEQLARVRDERDRVEGTEYSAFE